MGENPTLGKASFLGILQDDELLYIDKKEDLRNSILLFCVLRATGV